MKTAFSLTPSLPIFWQFLSLSFIGIILCAEKDSVDVELALDGLNKPIGVADYKLIIPLDKLKEIVQNEIAVYNQDRLNEGEDATDC